MEPRISGVLASLGWAAYCQAAARGCPALHTETYPFSAIFFTRSQ